MARFFGDGVAIIFGGILFFYPAGTLLWPVRLLGSYWLVVGLALMVFAVVKRAGIANLIRGILGVLICII